jgi:hypothetical protein
MTGWIEASVTLRGFSANPQEIVEFLGGPLCEVVRAGQRINDVSEAKYRENAIWSGLETDDPCKARDLIAQILHRWGGVDRVEQAVKIYSIGFSDFDVAIYDQDVVNSDLRAIFLDELIVRDIARLNGSIGISSHPITAKRCRLPKYDNVDEDPA